LIIRKERSKSRAYFFPSVNFKLFIVELRFANGAAAASFGLLIGHRAASEPFARRHEKGHSN
jgi:hypothetical protein